MVVGGEWIGEVAVWCRVDVYIHIGDKSLDSGNVIMQIDASKCMCVCKYCVVVQGVWHQPKRCEYVYPTTRGSPILAPEKHHHSDELAASSLRLPPPHLRRDL